VKGIIGEVQSGKTSAIINAIKDSPNICVVVVRNVGPDVRQFMNACRCRRLPAVTFSSDRDIQSLSCSVLEAPKVIVLLANACNVKKARQALEAVGSPPFSLYIDEADKIAFSAEPGDRSFRAELERLEREAAERVLVTATMFNFMTLADVGGVMRREDITFLGTAENYCGISDVLFGSSTLCEDRSDDAGFIPEDEIGADSKAVTRAPESFVAWLRDLLGDDVGRAKLEGVGHPVLALARMGNRIETIVLSAQAANKLAPGRILPIIYTGDGVAVPELLPQYLEERQYKVRTTRYKRAGGFVLVGGLSLQQFLSVLRESEVLGPRPLIVVCAGLLAGRCVNFADASYKWALTHEYYLPAKTTNVADLQQGLRLLGNKPWTREQFRPVLTTKRSVMKNIEVGCIVQRGARENLMQSCDATLMDAVHMVELDDKPTVRYAPNMVINSVKTKSPTQK
jgi:hypothetical protein